MQFVTKTCVLLIGTIGLTACDGPIEPFAFDTTYATFADIDAALGTAPDALVLSDGEIIDTSMVSSGSDFDAATGSVKYNGAVVMDQADASGTMIGQLQLEVAFDTNTMDGRAGNFIDSDDGAYTGTLLGNTTFIETVDTGAGEDHFSMALTGSLSNGGNSDAVTLTLGGNFFNNGSDVDSIAGDADINLGTAGPAYGEGAFGAVR